MDFENILVTLGITLDGMFRNRIGEMAESLIKRRITDWLRDCELIMSESPNGYEFFLPNDIVMRYGSEPDIEFIKEGVQKATIEIKGGTDPAGALERLGAVIRSFAETPPECVNFLVAGVFTEAMQARLDQIGVIKVFELQTIAEGGEDWNVFVTELFHHALRLRIPLAGSLSSASH